MHFGKHLLAKRHEPWASYYLDYKALKELLEMPMITTATIEPPGNDDVTTPPLFIELLHAQVERVVHFFLQQQGSLSLYDLGKRIATSAQASRRIGKGKFGPKPSSPR